MMEQLAKSSIPAVGASSSAAAADGGGGDDDDDDDIEIQDGVAYISLKCPLSIIRIRTPARGARCKHAQVKGVCTLNIV